jgi:NADH:ubiquinone oxidoreductase subunit 3 (subunit A)
MDMTNNKQQTAVEWFANQLSFTQRAIYNGVIEQAKEMEKEQILDAYECGFESEHDARIPQSSMIYYKQTYGGGEQ